MMAEFSLIEALENLYIDPYPTTQYRAIMRLMKDITIIMQDLHEVRICSKDGIVAKLTIKHEDVPESLKNSFIPTVEVYKMLSQKHLQKNFCLVLNKLLFYIIIKLNRCTGEEAASILRDFRELELCVYTFRKCSSWDNTKLDEIMFAFQKKLIRMIQEFSLENCNLKFHLFSVIRVMVMELGKHPAYSAKTVQYLIQQVKNYYQHVRTLEPMDGYVFENHLTYLYILNDLIGSNFLSNNKDEGKEALSHLKDILTENVAPCKLRPREAYLVQNILRITELYQFK